MGWVFIEVPYSQFLRACPIGNAQKGVVLREVINAAVLISNPLDESVVECWRRVIGSPGG